MAELTDFGPFGFGSANAGNLFEPMTDEQSFALFTAMWDAGVRHFDTAPHYGMGLAEERLGAFLRTKPRDEYHLSTKVGRIIEALDAPEPDPITEYVAVQPRRRVHDYSRDGIRRSLEDSLQRLGVDRVDTLYIHDPEFGGDELVAGRLATAIPACQELRDEGVVTAIGVGSCSVPALQVAVDLTTERGSGIDLLMVAGGFTLLTQPAHPQLLETSRAIGVRFVATAPFNSGLLATHPPRRDSHFDYAAVPNEMFDAAVSLAGVCERHGVELPTAALHFPLQYEDVAAVVTGAGNAEQVRQTAARMSQAVPAALWHELQTDGRIPSAG